MQPGEAGRRKGADGSGENGGDFVGMKRGKLGGKGVPSCRGGLPKRHDFVPLGEFPLPKIVAFACGEEMHAGGKPLGDEHGSSMAGSGQIREGAPHQQRFRSHFF